MTFDERRNQLNQLFQDIDEKELIEPLIEEVAFLEKRMSELREMPFISVNPKNKHQTKPTTYARQYKECLQSYKDAIRILINVLRKAEFAEQEELLKRLEEFA